MKSEQINRFLEVLNEYHSLGIAEQIDYQKFYLYSLITHSTAIEGSTVTEVENQLLFDEGITAKGRSLQEQMMNLDLKVAYEHSMQLARKHADFSVDMLKALSALVMKNTGSQYNTPQGSFDASRGDLRLLGVTAGTGGQSYMNFQKVPSKLAEFCQLTNERRHQLMDTDDLMEQYLLSFDAHCQLVTIHPWADGNGRMSRLVMNHLQYEFGLVPVKIVKEDKADYIQALIETRRQESLEPFREFMLEEHIRNLSKEIKEYKQSQNDPINIISDPIKVLSDPIKQRLYEAVLRDGSLNYAGYAALLGVSEATVKRRLNELKKEGAIVRVGSNKTGNWEIKNTKKGIDRDGETDPC